MQENAADQGIWQGCPNHFHSGNLLKRNYKGHAKHSFISHVLIRICLSDVTILRTISVNQIKLKNGFVSSSNMF